MSPDTVHRIAQEIRHKRADLTSEEKWVRTLPHSEMKIALFQRINFWRAILSKAEHEIATGTGGIAQG